MGIRTADSAKLHWEGAIDTMPQFVCLIDGTGIVRRANRGAEGWKPRIGAASVEGKRFHEILHRDCSDPSCYLKRFELRAIGSLAKGKSARCDAWDPVFKKHFSLCARLSVAPGRRTKTVTGSFALSRWKT